jgi:hypothetical protein
MLGHAVDEQGREFNRVGGKLTIFDTVRQCQVGFVTKQSIS